MAEEVKIVDVAGGPAAEATLQKLLDSMRRLEKAAGGSGGGGGSASSEAQSQYNRAVSEGTKTRKENTKAVEEATEATTSFSNALGRGVGKIFGMFTSVIGAGIGIAQNLFEAFGDGTGTLTDMIQTVPLIGGLLAKLTAPFDDALDSFRQLSTTGASFNNDLTQLRASAAGAKVSLASFTSFMAENSEKMAAFGGTVTQGAQAFARNRRALRAHEQDLLNMGLSFEDINDSLANYMYMQRAGSRAQTRDATAQAAAAASYTKNLMKLSKLTGEDIQTQQDALAQQRMNVAFQRKYATMSVEERRRMDILMAETLQSGGQTAVNALMAEFLNMPALTDEMALYQSNFGESMNVIRRGLASVTDDQISAAEFDAQANERLVDMLSGQSAAADRLGSLLDAAAAGADGPLASLNEMFSNAGIQYTKYIDANGRFDRERALADLAAAEEENEERNTLTRGLTNFQNQLRTLREKLELYLIGPLGNAIGPALDGLATAFQNMNDSGFDEVFETVRTMIGNFANDIQTFGFKDALGNLLTDIGEAAKPVFDSMIQELKSMIFGQTREEVQAEIQETIDALNTAETDLTSRIADINADMARGNLDPAQMAAARQDLANYEAQLTRVRDRQTEANTQFDNAEGSAGLMGTAFNTLKTFASGLATTFSELDTSTLLVIGAGALGLVGLAVALKAIAGPAALVMGAMGLAAGGLGFMFQGVSAVIDSITQGVGTLADGLDKLSKIDGSNLSVVGDGIGAIAPHLTDLAVGGVVASFISDGAFEKLAAGITALNGAQTGNMATVGVGLDSIQAALLKFSASAILTNFVGGNALQDITAGIDALNDAKTGNMATVAQGLDAVDGALAKFAAASFIANFVTNDALTALATGITALDSASVANMTTIAAGMDAVAVPLAKFAAGGILASLMSDTALQDLAGGITAIDSAGVTNIPLVASAMDMLAGPLVTMAGTGVLLRFIGDNSFGNLASQLSQFETLNPQTLHEVGPALKALNEGIQAFTGGSILESLGGAISGFFSGLFGGDEYEDLIEDLKKFEEVNTRKIYEVGQGLQGIANFVGGDVDVGDIRIGTDQLQRLSDLTKTLDSDSINSYNDALEELVETLKKLTDELGENAGVQGESNANVATLLNNLTTGSNESTGDKLDQLNSTMTAVLMTLQTSGRYTRQTRDAARAGANDLQAGF